MVRSGALRGSLIVLVAGVLSLSSACAGDSSEAKPFDGDSNKSAQPSASSTPTPTPSPTPASPSPSRGDTEQQLHNATVHFYEVVAKAFRDLDPKAISTVTVPGSRAGSGYVSSIKELKRKGQRFSPPVEYEIKDFSYKSDEDLQVETVTFRLRSSRVDVVDSDNKVVSTFEAGSSEARITFEKRGSKWLAVMQEIDTQGS